ncbi:hypothetical protein AB0D04_03020 [Streptomyces sp. NPDC048483]|uniref:hypothetical protein n=1 Tax=Streptomyces sp. NPDC048483 TaxID=3154927 RepID=UPI003445281B
MTAHRSRRRSAAYAALALALCGSLALTGCNSKSKKSKKTSSSSSYKSKKHKIIGGAGAGAGAGAAANRTRPCTIAPGSYKLTTAGGSTAPSHLILQYRNTRSASCYLYGAPMLFFPDTTKEEGYDRMKPLGFYEGTPDSLVTHRIEVKAKGYAYASIPTKTAADKGTKQNMLYLGAMRSNSAELYRAATPVRYGHYKTMLRPSLGKTAKVSDWYLYRSMAEDVTDTELSDGDK